MTEDPTDDTAFRNRISRRHLLAASAATTVGLTGCLGVDDADEDDTDEDDGETDENGDDGDPQAPADPDELPGPGSAVLEDPPDRVYLPSHREVFEFLPMEQVGEYEIMPHYTYSHTFWLMRGEETVEQDPQSQELHFMFAFWDAETGQMLPADVTGPMRVYKDGEIVDGPRTPWPMIAQGMGFHFGDNIPFASEGHEGPFPEAGTYEIDLELQPISIRKTGEFAGRFEDTVSTTLEFEFDPEDLQRINDEIEFFDQDRWGAHEAIPLMDHSHGDHGHGDDDGHDEHSDGHDGHNDDDGHEEHSDGHDGHGGSGMALDHAEAYPGETLGLSENGELPSSHDARFVIQYIEDSRLAEGSENYLLVSPRTPFNRIPLTSMSLSVEGDIEADLVETLDSEVGHHYGTTIDIPEGAAFDIVVDSPPQVSRHRGYQTAFLDMPSMSIER